MANIQDYFNSIVPDDRKGMFTLSRDSAGLLEVYYDGVPLVKGGDELFIPRSSGNDQYGYEVKQLDRVMFAILCVLGAEWHRVLEWRDDVHAITRRTLEYRMKTGV